jgi:hypothetical protein
MNIFILDTDPVVAAQYICDQHLNKMILESAQMLSTVVHLKLPGLARGIYRPIQPKHPCVLWLQEDQYNCEWLWKHCHAMDMERGYRFPTRTVHASMEVASHAMNLLDDNWFGDSKGRTQFTRVVPAHILQCGGTITEAYRRYYREKSREWFDAGKQPMKWTKRGVPYWFIPALEGL